MAAALPNGGTHIRVDQYANEALKVLRKNLVTQGDLVFSSDYEGVAKKGGSVQVPVRDGEVVIGDYDVLNGGTLGQSATSYLNVLITDDKYFGEIIDGYEANAVPDDLAKQRNESAAYSMSLEMDTDALAVLEAQGTTSTDTVAVTKADVYSKILAEKQALAEADVNLNDIYIIATPATVTLLKQDTAFAGASSDVATEMRMKGVIDMVDGSPLLVSNNLGANTEFIVGSKSFCQRVLAFTALPGIKELPQGTYPGASALSGRYVRKHIVTRAETVRVKTKA